MQYVRHLVLDARRHPLDLLPQLREHGLNALDKALHNSLARIPQNGGCLQRKPTDALEDLNQQVDATTSDAIDDL